jgi:hypothetical protein
VNRCNLKREKNGIKRTSLCIVFGLCTEDLGTICLNTVECTIREGSYRFSKITRPTQLQQQALDLLGVSQIYEEISKIVGKFALYQCFDCAKTVMRRPTDKPRKGKRLFWIWWVKCILRYSPAGEGVEGTTPDTEDTKIDQSHVS